jgi:hypothetical protein
MICKKLFSIVIVYVLLLKFGFSEKATKFEKMWKSRIIRTLKLNNVVTIFLKSHLDAISKTLWAICPISLSRVIENIFCKWFLSILGHDWWDHKRYYLKRCQKWTTIGFYIYRISSYSFLPWIVSPPWIVSSPSEETIQVFIT